MAVAEIGLQTLANLMMSLHATSDTSSVDVYTCAPETTPTLKETQQGFRRRFRRGFISQLTSNNNNLSTYFEKSSSIVYSYPPLESASHKSPIRHYCQRNQNIPEV